MEMYIFTGYGGWKGVGVDIHMVGSIHQIFAQETDDDLPFEDENGTRYIATGDDISLASQAWGL